LEVLEGRPGEAVTRKFLLEKVFGHDEAVKTRILDVHASRLRAKLADKVDVRNPGVRGVGNILERCCVPTEPGPKQNFRVGTIGRSAAGEPKNVEGGCGPTVTVWFTAANLGMRVHGT
jgi:Transcriptional regulatory protein, C terminal